MYVDVDFATCEGCPAGQDGGLCQHIFALLMAIEKFGPRPGCSILPGEQSVTSLRQSWGIRERDVKPHSVSQVVIEKSSLMKKGRRERVEVCCLMHVGKNYKHSMRTHTDVCATKCSCWELDFLFRHLLTGRRVHMEIHPKK